jgi:hypothetical protein
MPVRLTCVAWDRVKDHALLFIPRGSTCLLHDRPDHSLQHQSVHSLPNDFFTTSTFHWVLPTAWADGHTTHATPSANVLATARLVMVQIALRELLRAAKRSVVFDTTASLLVRSLFVFPGSGNRDMRDGTAIRRIHSVLHRGYPCPSPWLMVHPYSTSIPPVAGNESS